ncbi:T9SS type A sorting domain-containing protein [Sphingobacterium sp. SYP-B4668]|uniref:T9SS type A sorting domain-containing protein n=1 Tax=Sphingobacterium sp. SYP-B4668 TaxID=2996035 RepID=UPI0005323E6B|nr:T9SS type A sorting domain-containing protein [Sphingobacterium sp. SYP-B4668]
MKIFTKKRLITTFTNALVLVASLGFAWGSNMVMASDSSLKKMTLSNKSNFSTSRAAKYFNNDSFSDFGISAAKVFSATESDKLINNVKVFYNPIAEQVTVSFKLGKQNTVSIKVMDALGNEVLSLMNGSLDAGNQNLAFDTNKKLTSGFYFVRLVAGTETVVKRISVR